MSSLVQMSGKHVKLRAWRRGGGTPVRSILLGGAAWVSVSAVLAVAVPGEPLAEHGAGQALPSPSTPTEGADRDPVVSRSVDRGGDARRLVSPSADAAQPAGPQTLLGAVTGVGEDLAETALSAADGATPSAPELSTSPSAEPETSPDSPGPRPSDDDSGSGTPEPQPSDDPAPSEDDESEEDDEPSEGPGPSLELPTVPPIDLP